MSAAPPGRNGHYTLPHSLDAEASVLGGILLDPPRLKRIDKLEVEDFYDHKHKVVFQAMRNLDARAVPIDIITLENEIVKAGKIEAIGGVAFLGELTLKVPTADNFETYAFVVKLHATNRRAMVELGQALETAGRGSLEPEELLDETIGSLLRLREDLGTKRQTIEVRTLASFAADITEQAKLPTLDWGVDGLNAKAPLPIRAMATIVGPTGAGKTALAMQLAAHRTRYRDKPSPQQGPTLHFLFELTRPQLAARRTAQLSRFSWGQILGGVMSTAEVHETLTGENYFVFKPPRRVDLTNYVNDALDAVGKLCPGVPLAVFDYLQRIKLAERGGRELREQTSDIVDSIVDIVESRDMFGLLISKGNRTGSRAMRDGKTRGEALVDAAAEASAIEAGSAAVLAITYENRDGGDETLAAIQIAKGRFGATGACVGMLFHGPSGSWKETDAPVMSVSDRSAEDRVMAALDKLPGGYDTRNALSKAAGGNRQDNLYAIRRLHAPGGPIVEVSGKLCRR